MQNRYFKKLIYIKKYKFINTKCLFKIFVFSKVFVKFYDKFLDKYFTGR